MDVTGGDEDDDVTGSGEDDIMDVVVSATIGLEEHAGVSMTIGW